MLSINGLLSNIFPSSFVKCIKKICPISFIFFREVSNFSYLFIFGELHFGTNKMLSIVNIFLIKKYWNECGRVREEIF